MNLIIFNDYIPPAPTSYDINCSDVNGEHTTVEDGTTYIEQVRANIPEITVSWTNLTDEQVTRIFHEVKEDTVEVQFYFGSMQRETMTKGSRSLKLKSIDDKGNHYWNLSLTLKA